MNMVGIITMLNSRKNDLNGRFPTISSPSVP